MNLYDFLPPEEHRPSRNNLNLEDTYGRREAPTSPFTYLLGLECTTPMTVSFMAGLRPPLISPTYCSTCRNSKNMLR